MKLELILRLLDNDELSPDQVNDLKEFLEDYVECNQVGFYFNIFCALNVFGILSVDSNFLSSPLKDDFERFDDVDAFYSSLPLDKVEALEDLVTLCPSGLAKVSS